MPEEQVIMKTHFVGDDCEGGHEDHREMLRQRVAEAYRREVRKATRQRRLLEDGEAHQEDLPPMVMEAYWDAVEQVDVGEPLLDPEQHRIYRSAI